MYLCNLVLIQTQSLATITLSHWHMQVKLTEIGTRNKALIDLFGGRQLPVDLDNFALPGFLL